MKKDIDRNLFIFNLYSDPKDYFPQKATKEHTDRFSASNSILKPKKNNENK